MYEVDYLAVGEKSASGDAIALRFTRPDHGTNAVVIIDGGYASNGQEFVDLVTNYYGTTVDLVVSTHQDADHMGGLTTVIEQLNVQNLLIHRPALYGYTDADGVSATRVEELVALAEARGVNIVDRDFAGTTYFGGALMIAGPSEDFYLGQLAAQRIRENSALAKFAHAAPILASAMVREIKNLFGDPGETMTGDNGGTNARNNMSVILDLWVEDDDKRALFTGDAGAPALIEAADLLYAAGRDQRPIDMFGIPHNGSRHNLTPELLDRLLGPKHQPEKGIAIVSVAKEAHEYPRPEVANAIKRRGYPVYATRGTTLWWHSTDAPFRPAYNGQAQPLDWLDESEDGDSASGSGAA
ncbi:MAG: hypothetical protein JWQ32_2209 [Marmoricola sp.]|nr:hypothetical protein [Marmoricola sp.]